MGTQRRVDGFRDGRQAWEENWGSLKYVVGSAREWQLREGRVGLIRGKEG